MSCGAASRISFIFDSLLAWLVKRQRPVEQFSTFSVGASRNTGIQYTVILLLMGKHNQGDKFYFIFDVSSAKRIEVQSLVWRIGLDSYPVLYRGVYTLVLCWFIIFLRTVTKHVVIVWFVSTLWRSWFTEHTEN